ncbi:hypothetical protein FJR48_11760 [Sulfurimonas lithotrophica]|uniref:Uncharacterized protein n=1 Tax=Sulfurimonas lithotrophica TaxID=2590022 RepID=A0A5P8P3W2_9BACT|nr:hypothetical protein [Sulfurimonas lithotrophica]QFR50365.1 hypothetical protein FJR48_11760 [Sulfurimonas lithotrophica]
MSTISTSVSNIYDLANETSVAMKNLDSKRAFSTGSDLQKLIQQTQQEMKKGTTEEYKNSLYKLDVRA